MELEELARDIFVPWMPLGSRSQSPPPSPASLIAAVSVE